MIFRILTRDFAAPLYLPDLDFKVKRYSKHIRGGPEKAEVSTSGASWKMFELLEWLGCPVEILDDHLVTVWWGYLNEVTVTVGAVKAGARLDEMYNRVALVYLANEPGSNGGGTRATTSWAQDDASVAVYGTKEFRASASESPQEQAEDIRDLFLAERKNPIPTITLEGGSRSEYAVRCPASLIGTAELSCKGWWETLEWEYYDQLAGIESHETTGSATQPFGNDTESPKVAQSATISSTLSWYVGQIDVRMARVGNPTDGVVIKLYSNSSGTLGSLLGTSATVDHASIDTSADYISFTFSTPVAVTAGATYWLEISRTEEIDGDNYYQVSGDQTLAYTGGVFRVWDGGNWVAAGTDMDLNFKLLGLQLNTQQITQIVTDCGQFLEGTWVQSAGTVQSNQYRSGDNTALHEIEELLKPGAGGGAALLAMVDVNRTVVISAEPSRDPYTAEVTIDREGLVRDRWGNVKSGQDCPVGVWAVLQDVVPASLDLGKFADPSIIFIERAEYDAERKKYTPTGRKARTVFDIATVVINE